MSSVHFSQGEPIVKNFFVAEKETSTDVILVKADLLLMPLGMVVALTNTQSIAKLLLVFTAGFDGLRGSSQNKGVWKRLRWMLLG